MSHESLVEYLSQEKYSDTGTVNNLCLLFQGEVGEHGQKGAKGGKGEHVSDMNQTLRL